VGTPNICLDDLYPGSRSVNSTAQARKAYTFITLNWQHPDTNQLWEIRGLQMGVKPHLAVNHAPNGQSILAMKVWQTWSAGWKSKHWRTVEQNQLGSTFQPKSSVRLRDIRRRAEKKKRFVGRRGHQRFTTVFGLAVFIWEINNARCSCHGRRWWQGCLQPLTTINATGGFKHKVFGGTHWGMWQIRRDSIQRARVGPIQNRAFGYGDQSSEVVGWHPSVSCWLGGRVQICDSTNGEKLCVSISVGGKAVTFISILGLFRFLFPPKRRKVAAVTYNRVFLLLTIPSMLTASLLLVSSFMHLLTFSLLSVRVMVRVNPKTWLTDSFRASHTATTNDFRRTNPRIPSNHGGVPNFKPGYHRADSLDVRTRALLLRRPVTLRPATGEVHSPDPTVPDPWGVHKVFNRYSYWSDK